MVRVAGVLLGKVLLTAAALRRILALNSQPFIIRKDMKVSMAPGCYAQSRSASSLKS